MEYSVNGRTLKYEVSNDVIRGEDVVLLDSAVDLTRNQPWHDQGFVIAKLFDTPAAYAEFTAATDRLLRRCWSEAGIEVPVHLPLSHYHHVASDLSLHLQAIAKTKLVSLRDFPVPIGVITQRVSELLACPVEGRNPYDRQEVFHFRVVRPSSGDNNPLHRDVWLEDYSNCINLYIPVAGSTEQSSLILLPESHRWAESRLERTRDGAVINGVRFNVPAITSIFGNYEAVRPNPQANEFLLFSPYLAHGGAVNFNEHETRISIELRLWKSDRHT